MLLNALCDFYQRASRDGIIEESGFTKKYIRWIIPLDSEGNLEGNGLIENPRKEGRHFVIPRSSRPKNAGGVAEFLWDGLEAIFSLSNDQDSIEPDETKRAQQETNRKIKNDDFWKQITSASENLNSAPLKAVLKFHHKCSHASFLRWGKLTEDTKKENPCWMVKVATGKEEKFKADNFTFQVSGEILLDNEILKEYWREQFVKERQDSESSSEIGICLITGKENVPISASHLPKITGVPGTTSTGATLVSFDKDSFQSYGLDKSYNSPISLPAVEEYCNSLNFLISNHKHSLKIGGIVLCFWAKESQLVSDLFSELLEKPRAEVIRDLLKKPLKGNGDFSTTENDQFYSVTLAGNSGRVIVKNWMHITVGQAVENYKKWFEDLNIVSLSDNENADYPPLSLFRLAVTTVREPRDLRSEVSLQLYRAALEGNSPSIMLLKPILHRLSTELAKDGLSALNNLSRFALLRLIINRNRKDNDTMIEPNITDIEDVAYNCGRLLAIFDDLQMAAHDYQLEGAGVTARYYGSASSAPNSAFGILWRLHQHHLKKVGRKNRGKAEAITKKIENISMKFQNPSPNKPPQFPRSFNLQQQGRFALGFYQQKASDRHQRTAYLDSKKNQITEELIYNNEINGE